MRYVKVSIPHLKFRMLILSILVMDGMNPKRKLNKQLKKMVEVIRGVYKDDRQVTKLLVVKRYAERPRVEVRVKRDTGDYNE